MAGFNHPDVLELLREVWQRPSYPVYQRVGARLSDIKDLAQAAGQRRVRIAVLSSFTLDPIKPYLQVACIERGTWAEVFIPGFNQFAQQILDPESDLYTFQPDVCFLHITPEAVLDRGDSSSIVAGQVESLVETIGGLVQAFRSRCKGDLVVSNFSAPARFPYSLRQDEVVGLYGLVNNKLERVAKEVPGVHVLDHESLTAYHGKESVADERLRHIARMELGDRFLPKLANKMLSYVLALRGLGRKCIVLDLDNTLWGGVVGEDGFAGIQLGPEYPGSAFVEFQQSLLTLHQRGILLAINSKNNEADAIEVLAQNPAMVLRPNHFAAMRINWRDKCENIEAIAKELNLGLESVVFIDDSPVERDLMRRLRPEVLTPEWPEDMVLYRTALESLCDFETLSVTEEDLRRGEMYVAQGEREEFRKRSGSLEEHLFGLRMEVLLNEAKEADIPRIHQLVQKTNQFNLTTRRYSLAEIEGLCQRNDAVVYVLRNRDRFGDNGLVGIAVLIKEDGSTAGPTWRFDSLLMSCRVLGRTIETGFLKYILEELKAKGCRYAIGEFISTAKNALVKDFYAEAGFQPMEVREETQRWILDLSVYVPPSLPWLSVNPAASSP